MAKKAAAAWENVSAAETETETDLRETCSLCFGAPVVNCSPSQSGADELTHWLPEPSRAVGRLNGPGGRDSSAGRPPQCSVREPRRCERAPIDSDRPDRTRTRTGLGRRGHCALPDRLRASVTSLRRAETAPRRHRRRQDGSSFIGADSRAERADQCGAVSPFKWRTSGRRRNNSQRRPQRCAARRSVCAAVICASTHRGHSIRCERDNFDRIHISLDRFRLCSLCLLFAVRGWRPVGGATEIAPARQGEKRRRENAPTCLHSARRRFVLTCNS